MTTEHHTTTSCNFGFSALGTSKCILVLKIKTDHLKLWTEGLVLLYRIFISLKKILGSLGTILEIQTNRSVKTDHRKLWPTRLISLFLVSMIQNFPFYKPQKALNIFKESIKSFKELGWKRRIFKKTVKSGGPSFSTEKL